MSCAYFKPVVMLRITVYIAGPVRTFSIFFTQEKYTDFKSLVELQKNVNFFMSRLTTRNLSLLITFIYRHFTLSLEHQKFKQESDRIAETKFNCCYYDFNYF